MGPVEIGGDVVARSSKLRHSIRALTKIVRVVCLGNHFVVGIAITASARCSKFLAKNDAAGVWSRRSKPYDEMIVKANVR